MRKRWIWWLVILFLGTALYFFTASSLSNNAHTLQLLRRLTFLSTQEIVMLSKIVRKTAHVLTYAVMAICLRNALYPYQRTYPVAWLLVTLYGASDEIHQIYVMGRTPLLTDVLIDSVGAASGLLIIYWRHRQRMRKLPASILRST